MSAMEKARAALKAGYDTCEAIRVCNCDKQGCSAFLNAIAAALDSERRAERRAALEEAAGVCESLAATVFHPTQVITDRCAAAIRARINMNQGDDVQT